MVARVEYRAILKVSAAEYVYILTSSIDVPAVFCTLCQFGYIKLFEPEPVSIAYFTLR